MSFPVWICPGVVVYPCLSSKYKEFDKLCKWIQKGDNSVWLLQIPSLWLMCYSLANTFLHPYFVVSVQQRFALVLFCRLGKQGGEVGNLYLGFSWGPALYACAWTKAEPSVGGREHVSVEVIQLNFLLKCQPTCFLVVSQYCNRLAVVWPVLLSTRSLVTWPGWGLGVCRPPFPSCTAEPCAHESNALGAEANGYSTQCFQKWSSVQGLNQHFL